MCKKDYNTINLKRTLYNVKELIYLTVNFKKYMREKDDYYNIMY